MKIQNITINGGQANFTDKINKLSYISKTELDDNQFKLLISSIQSLSISKQNELENLFEEVKASSNVDKKESTSMRIKAFLINNGISIASSLTASGIIELVKHYFG